MEKLRLKDLCPGHILALDILNYSGEVLLYKGNKLKERDIKNLKAWGIMEAFVENSAGTRNARASDFDHQDLDPKLLAEAEQEARTLFSFSKTNHPFIKELIRLSTLNRLKKKPGMENLNVY